MIDVHKNRQKLSYWCDKIEYEYAQACLDSELFTLDFFFSNKNVTLLLAIIVYC